MSMESHFLGGMTEMELSATFGQAAIPAPSIPFVKVESKTIVLTISFRAIATQFYIPNCSIVVI